MMTDCPPTGRDCDDCGYDEADCVCYVCATCEQAFGADELSVAPTDDLARACGDVPRCSPCWDRLERDLERPRDDGDERHDLWEDGEIR